MKIKSLFCAGLLWFTAAATQAQQRTAPPPQKAVATKVQSAIYKIQPVNDHQQSIQLNIGSAGIGAAYNYGLNSKLALQGGINILPVKAHNVVDFSDFNSTSDADVKMTNLHLHLNYTPFKNAAGFRLVGGLAYFAHAKGTFDVQPSDTYKYGDIQLTPEQVGHVTFTADWQGIAPYAGIGLFPMFPKHKFNVNVDLGTYYLNRPKANIVGTGSLQGNSSQTAQFQENIKDDRWLPVVQLNFNYKL